MKTIPAKLKSIIKIHVYFLKLQWKFDKLSIFIIIASALFNTLNSLVIVIFPGYILDCLADSDRQGFMYAVLTFAFWELFVACIRAVFRRISNSQCRKFSGKLNHMLVEKAMSLRYEQLESPEVLEQHEMAKRCVNENKITEFLSGTASLVFAIAELISLMYILKSMSVWVLVIFVIVTTTNAIVNIILAKKTVSQTEDEIPIEREKRYFSYELIKPKYAKEMRIFNLGDYVLRKHKESIEEYFATRHKYNKEQVQAIKYSSVAGRVLSAVFYIYCIISFSLGTLTVGTFSISVSALFRFSQLVGDAISMIINTSVRSTMLGRVMNYMNIPSLSTGVDDVSAFETGSIIEFVNVSYKYPNAENYSLKNVSMKIHHGEKISIVGPNGAGKTTFVGLLLGLYKPTEGKILYNGVDVEELDFSQYKKLFSVLLQDYQIYSFTVLDNLTFVDCPTALEKKFALELLEHIGLGDRIGSLPNKENTYISQLFDDSGIMFSGGEEQKLAIARTLYQHADIFIFDEPTSALSPINEYEIYKRFASLSREKTVMYISHRLSSCSLCDRIIVFNKGVIVEDGSHEELMKNNALYASMYQMQADMFM